MIKTTSDLGLVKRMMRSNYVRVLTFILLVAVAFETVIVWGIYNRASDHLEANDPRQLQNRSETTFYFAPLELSRGMAFNLGEMTAYLDELSYKNSPESVPASYLVSGNKLQVRSRTPRIFPDLTLILGGGRLTSILANGAIVPRAQIEPIQLQGVVDYIAADSLKKDLRIRRIVIQPGTLPDLIADAVISAEDKTFFQNSGVNWYSVTARPILTLGRQGGSSISQQLLKNNVFEGARDEFWQLGVPLLDRKLGGIERKIAEIPMALKLNQMMTKDEILAAYLSMNYMGTVSGVDLQGFAAASQEFYETNLFDISDPNDPVDVARACSLSGAIQAPGSYLKYVKQGEKCEVGQEHCKNLVKRRNDILNLLQANFPTKYSAEVISRAKDQPLGIDFASRKRDGRPIQAESRNFATFAASAIHLPDEVEKLRGEQGQVAIFTSLDPRLQQAAVDVLGKATSRIQKEVDRVYRQQRNFHDNKFADIETQCNMDPIRSKDGCGNLFKVRASLIAVDAKNGQILAMSSGIDINAKRSPGSLVKPFFYLKALESGEFKGQPFTAATYLDRDSDKGLLNEYCTDDSNLGGSGTVRKHVAMSWNIGACIAAQSAGMPIDFVGSLTNSRPERKLMAAIGGTQGSEVSLPDMVQAFTIFPNNGRMSRLTAYKAAFQTQGDSIRSLEFKNLDSAVVADPAATFITGQLMRSVVTEGTAAGFQSASGIPSGSIAGKSGSGMIADLWWINYTPGIVVGVWVGMPYNLPELRIEDGFTGGRISSPIAAAFMRELAKVRPDLAGGDFLMPERVIKRTIDRDRGCMNANGQYAEYFIAGREPNTCK